MKFLKAFDSVLFKVVYVVCALIMIALLVIVNIQVVSRFFFNLSLGGLSDLPPYLMIYAIWLGAILAARGDDHIKIQLLDLFVKNEKVQFVVSGILHIVTAAALIVFTKISLDYTASALAFGSVDNGTHIPLWCFYIVMPVGAGFMSLYYVVNAIKAFRRLKS